MLRIDRRIGFEVIESATCAPCPGAQCAPVLRLSRLSFVYESDNAARETGTVIGLNAGRIEHYKAPSGGNQLPDIRQVSIFVQLRKRERRRLRQLPRRMLREHIF